MYSISVINNAMLPIFQCDLHFQKLMVRGLVGKLMGGTWQYFPSDLNLCEKNKTKIKPPKTNLIHISQNVLVEVGK